MHGTDQDGTTNNLVPYIMVQNDTSKKGGTLRGLRIKKKREEYVYFNPPQASLK